MPRKAASATRTNTPTRSFTAISPLSSFIDSPRLRLRLALPHSSTRLAFGCGSHCHIHRLASPSAAARPATFHHSPPPSLSAPLPTLFAPPPLRSASPYPISLSPSPH